ncbi:glutamine-synthetase adenylyltransferase [Pseudogemmobacter sp. W21_MBD1_M6]|uniref:[protein-PII] uridylyltransferase family protein n=1 Tax=Pseudogemmobacter sp. W21_MBD1_M6 TaxID=3240271 RepID=UPI003F9DB4F6
MTFASRITRCPIAYDPERGADARALFADMPPEIADLTEGAGGCSPYLNGLMLREADWLREALSGAPETALNDVLHVASQTPLSGLADALRQAKRRVAVLTALADLGGVWSLEQVTGALTRLADLAVDTSMKALVGAEIARGKIPGLTEADAATAGGMVALAMGKMGAFELNYSSDIDLIMLFDEDRFDPADYMDARAAFIRVTRRMTAMLSDLTGEGYVFRTDLRLRPDPSVTPVCTSMDAAERYYESVGRTWERAAHIKARPCGGDLDAGWRYLDRLRPFVWRKHLDFAAIQDAHDMRLRIRDHKGLHVSKSGIALEGYNLKLGLGGIREIEFFTQTRQIIAGGRDPDLRGRETVKSLAALVDKGWVPADVAEVLTTEYRAHREVEHRLQMINDAQTHDLPQNADGFDRLARFMGQGDTQAMRAAIKARLIRVNDLTEGFFAPSAVPPAPELSETARQITSRWPTYPALRSERAVEIFRRLKPELLSRLARAAKPDEALVQMDGFLAGLPAGVQLFSLFDANPQLIDLIVDICSTAPALARYLSRNSSVFDAVIGGAFFDEWPGETALKDQLSAHLAEVPDYEAKLDSARRWMKEWHFRVGVHHLRGLIDADRAGRQYADLASAVIGGMWPAVLAEFEAKHGCPPGKGAVVLGMGSLGAGRLNAHSDLDLIVIYDGEGVEMSEGRRPLATRPYYARLTQALVTAVTVQTSEGRLYEVDMRLRPSGRQGPVATSLDAFQSYQLDEAWTWEHLALTRARPVAGDPALAKAVETFRLHLLSKKGAPQKTLADVLDMRTRIAEAKPAKGAWEAKLGPGRLQDVELVAQAAALMAGDPSARVEDQLAAGVRSGWLPQAGANAMAHSYRLMWRLQSAARLLTDGPLVPGDVGIGGTAFVLRETGAASLDALADMLTHAAAEAQAAIESALAHPPASAKELV